MTRDVDVAVLAVDSSSLDLKALEQELTSRIGEMCFHSADLPFKRAHLVRFVCGLDSLILDLILANAEYSAQALAHPGRVEILGKDYPVLLPEDVILFKALGKREKDFGPIRALARANELDRAYLEHWARRLGVWTFVRRGLKSA